MVDPALPDPASLETARPGRDGPRARPRRVPSLPTLLASAACFLVVFEFLAFQLRSGRDPAIGASASEPTAARPRPVVIHRRIIVRRVVESSPDVSSVPVGGGSSSGSSSTASAAPVAPVAAPAPAPAPVTSTS
jgi:hypothetical protein